MPKTNKKNETKRKPKADVVTTTAATKANIQAIIKGVQDGLKVRKPPTFLEAVGDAVRAAAPAVTGLAKIVGMGDYVVEANTVATGGTAAQSVPNFQGMKGNRIRHKECLGVITGPGTPAFSILKKITLNPGSSTSFPWLSSFAGNFTGYKVHGAAYVFESNTSEYSAVPYMGTICMGTRYDTREPDFSSMVEMQNCKFSVSAKPSQNIIHPIECKDGFQPFDSWMVRRGNETNVQYGYDKCNVYVAVEGLQVTTAVLGRLWVTYDIELINPVTPAPVATTSFLSVMVDTGGNAVIPTTVSNSSTPWKALFENWNTNSTYNTSGGGVLGTDLVRYTDSVSGAPFAAVLADGKLRVYKSCIVALNWKVSGTGMAASSYGVTVNSVPNDGSVVTVRRTQGTGNSANFLCEGDVFLVRLVSNLQNNVPPAANTYYAEIELTGVGGTITSSSTQMFVSF